MPTKNIGTADRVIRLTLAIIFLLLAWWFSSWILLVVGLFVSYEALAGWCVVYALLGRNSCPLDKK